MPRSELAKHEYPPEELLDWTPRQEEVLELLARRRSNAEIAEELGITLEGAKHHVRQVMSKLDVDNREDAAEYWRWRNGLPRRLQRTWRHALGIAPLKWVGGASGTAKVIALGAIVAAAGGAVLAFVVLDSAGESPEPPQHPLEEVSEEVLALFGIRLREWTSDTEGLLSYEAAHRRASFEGEPVELALAEMKRIDEPANGWITRPPDDGPIWEPPAGPLWTAVYAEPPAASVDPDDPDMTIGGRPIAGFVNIRFFDAETGRFVRGLSAVMTAEGWPHDASE